MIIYTLLGNKYLNFCVYYIHTHIKSSIRVNSNSQEQVFYIYSQRSKSFHQKNLNVRYVETFYGFTILKTNRLDVIKYTVYFNKYGALAFSIVLKLVT